MKYTKIFLQKKSKKELIDIILKAQLEPLSTRESLDQIHSTILDGTQGMRTGE